MLEETEILSQPQPAPHAADNAKDGGIRETLHIALPMVLSLSFDTLMVFVDRLFLSRLGPEYMSASLAGGNANFMMLTLFMGLLGYTTAMVAQNLGAGRPERGSIVVTHALGIALLAYPVLLLLRPLVWVLFSKANLDPRQLEPQLVFYNTLVLGAFIPLLRQVFSSFFSGIGETRVIMVSSFVGMATNALLNYALIFGHFGMPALGIRGAAIGTICAGAVSLGILAGKYFSPSIRKRFHSALSWKFDRTLLAEFVRKGTPAGAEFFLDMLAFQMMILLFQGKGLVGGTAATVMFSWDMVTFVPLIGLEVAATSLVGRFTGAGNIAAVRRSTWSGIRLGWIFSAFVLVAFLGIPELLVNVFRPEHADATFQQAFPIAVTMLRIAAIYIGIESIMVVYAGALRGSGDTFWTMVIMVGLHWFIVAQLWVMYHKLDLGVIVSWAAMVGGFMMFPLLLWLRWRVRLRQLTNGSSSVPS